MPGPNDPGTRPMDVIAAAKIRARAALNEKNPRLTTLERAFYNLFRQHGG